MKTEENDIPYYPKRLEADKKILTDYKHEALQSSQISFLGRLATYRYMDMHHVIGEALSFAAEYLQSLETNKNPPVFPHNDF
jgi:UDP-galactopyranose mutase